MHTGTPLRAAQNRQAAQGPLGAMQEGCALLSGLHAPAYTVEKHLATGSLQVLDGTGHRGLSHPQGLRSLHGAAQGLNSAGSAQSLEVDQVGAHGAVRFSLGAAVRKSVVSRQCGNEVMQKLKHAEASRRRIVTDALLVLGLGLVYPLVHTLNHWVFSFAEINPNVALVYLPAFLRLLNVLLLGKVKGLLAGLLGGVVIFLSNQQDPLLLRVVNMLCSAAGPVLAVLIFEQWFRRSVSLVSLRDLSVVTVIYCLANALLHHFAWVLLAPQLLGTPQQMIYMVIGDLIGALIGAYLLKWSAERLGIAAPPR